jgi:glucose-1-phosphate adenylyltransferase
MQRHTGTLAMILAGSRVDELNVLTLYRPKSTLPFGGHARVIDFPLSNLMHSGLNRVGILSQYRSYSLIEHIGIGASWDMIGRHRGISILPPYHGSEEMCWYRGSADAVYRNLDFVRYHNPENVLILSGDHVYCMDYREILEFHEEHSADLTIAFLKVPRDRSANRFGVAELDDSGGLRGGRVLSYEEKPAEPRGEWASLTIFCFRPQVLYEVLEANAAEQDSHEFGKDIIPRLIREGRRVYGYRFNGYWGYTRTLEEYWQTNMDLLGPEPRIPLREWKLRVNLDHRRIRDRPPLKTGSQAEINNSLVYNGSRVEGRVENSILFPGVHIGRGTTVRDSIIFFDNRIGEGCSLDRVISDADNTFGNGCTAGGGSPGRERKLTVIGQENAIPDNTVIQPGCLIYPRLEPGSIPGTVATGKVLR